MANAWLKNGFLTDKLIEMDFKEIIEDRIVCLVTYFKSTNDRNIKEICRNEIEFLEGLVKNSVVLADVSNSIATEYAEEVLNEK